MGFVEDMTNPGSFRLIVTCWAAQLGLTRAVIPKCCSSDIPEATPCPRSRISLPFHRAASIRNPAACSPPSSAAGTACCLLTPRRTSLTPSADPAGSWSSLALISNYDARPNPCTNHPTTKPRSLPSPKKKKTEINEFCSIAAERLRQLQNPPWRLLLHSALGSVTPPEPARIEACIKHVLTVHSSDLVH